MCLSLFQLNLSIFFSNRFFFLPIFAIAFPCIDSILLLFFDRYSWFRFGSYLLKLHDTMRDNIMIFIIFQLLLCGEPVIIICYCYSTICKYIKRVKHFVWKIKKYHHVCQIARPKRSLNHEQKLCDLHAL